MKQTLYKNKRSHSDDRNRDGIRAFGINIEMVTPSLFLPLSPVVTDSEQ